MSVYAGIQARKHQIFRQILNEVICISYAILMRTKKFETRLYLNSNFENYDIELKNIRKHQLENLYSDAVECKCFALIEKSFLYPRIL